MKKVVLLHFCSVFLASCAVHAVVPPFDTFSFSAADANYPGGAVTGTGVFTFDSSLIPVTGVFELAPTNAAFIGLTFAVLGQSFTEADDLEFPAWPLATFQDGSPTGFDLLLVEPGSVVWAQYIADNPTTATNFTSIFQPNVASIYIGNATLVDGGSGNFTTTMDIEVIPEPTTLSLIGLGSLALLVVRRHRLRFKF